MREEGFNLKKNKDRLSVWEITSYSLGSLGKEFSNNCISSFFLVYLCIYQGLNPIVMTVAFMLAKLWDAVNDPILATLVNNTKGSKLGRYRQWILIGAVLNAATLVIMFLPLPESVGTAGKYAYYIFAYVIWGMSFTVVDVPFWSMLPAIANTTEDRNRASSMARLIGGLGGFLVGSIGTSVILPAFSSIGMNRAYMVIGAVSGVIMISFVSVTVVFNREKYPIPHTDVGLGTIFEMFKTNDQLRAYAVTFLLFTTGTTIALNQMLYLYIYCYEDSANLLSSKYSYTLFWIIACTGQGIAMFFYNRLTKKIPREKMFTFSYWACIVGYALMFIIFFFLKQGEYLLNAVLIALAGASLMLACGINNIGSTVMIADVVDYSEYKTGKRADSIVFSVQTLLQKFAGALAMFILGLGISAAKLPTISQIPITDAAGKFIENIDVYTAADGTYLINNEQVWQKISAIPEYAQKAQFVTRQLVSTESLTVLRAFMFLIPIPLCIVALIYYKKKYTLVGSKYDEIKAEIDRRRAEKTKEISDKTI